MYIHTGQAYFSSLPGVDIHWSNITNINTEKCFHVYKQAVGKIALKFFLTYNNRLLLSVNMAQPLRTGQISPQKAVMVCLNYMYLGLKMITNASIFSAKPFSLLTRSLKTSIEPRQLVSIVKTRVLIGY